MNSLSVALTDKFGRPYTVDKREAAEYAYRWYSGLWWSNGNADRILYEEVFKCSTCGKMRSAAEFCNFMREFTVENIFNDKIQCRYCEEKRLAEA